MIQPQSSINPTLPYTPLLIESKKMLKVGGGGGVGGGGKRARLHQAFVHWEFSCQHFGLNFDEDDDSQNIVAYNQRKQGRIFETFS